MTKWNPTTWFGRSPSNDDRTGLYAAINSSIGNLTHILQKILPGNWGSLRSGIGPNMKSNMALPAIFAAFHAYLGVIGSLPRFCGPVDLEGKLLKRHRTVDHPAARIWLHQAGSNLTSRRMLNLMIMDLLWDGNFYAIPVYNGSGQIVELRYVHPSRVPSGSIKYAEHNEKINDLVLGTVRIASDDELIVHIAAGDRLDDKSIDIPYNQIFHMPADTYDSVNFRGIGIRDNIAATSAVAADMTAFVRDFYSSGVRKQMFLSTEKEITAPVLAQLEQLLLVGGKDEKKPEWGNRDLGDIFRARILPHGLKPVFMGQLFQQLQFIETRAFGNEDIARFFRIPPGLLYSFMGQGATPDSLEGMITLWRQIGLGPFLSLLGDGYRDAVLPVSSRPNFTFGFNRIHLLNTVPEAGSMTVRNLIEVGVITRETAEDIFGIPGSQKGTRYIPANVLTDQHSAALADKARGAVDLQEAQIETVKANAVMTQERHDAAKANGFQPPVPPGQPGGDPAKSPGRKATPPGERTAPDNPKRDNRTKAVLNQAFIAVLNGLRSLEERVLLQKLAAKDASVENSLQPGQRTSGVEWIQSKFAEAANKHVTDWCSLSSELGTDPSVVINDWLLQSADVVNNSPTPLEDLAMSHSTRLATLIRGLTESKEVDHEDPGSES